MKTKTEKTETGKTEDLRKAFVESVYQTLDGVISPTPYMEIKSGDVIDVKFLNGQGRLPTPGATEVTVLDIDTASLFFDDFNVLYEGVTGVGKTYTSDALFNAVFGPDGHTTLRLSTGIMGNSALEPFTKTVLDNGMPKVKIDPEKCTKYGALFIDEINRGDSQEVFQVVDGKIHINGDKESLRIPIPGTNPQRYKSLAIIAAMNPADAEHKSAVELDIAGENRFLKFKFPNGVAEAASSQLEKKVVEDLHGKFWDTFRKRTGMSGTWRDIYPVVTDPQALRVELDGATREFIDVALGYVGHNPSETYDRNKDLISQAGIRELKFKINENNDYKKVLEAQNILKHGFVRRDLGKIENLSRLIGFIKSIKDGTYTPKVEMGDVGVSIGVVLESKTITGSDNGKLISLVNDARKAYADLRAELNVPQGFGFRQNVLQSAISVGQEQGIDGYVNTLTMNMDRLNAQLTPQQTSPSYGTIKSRLLADLSVLQHFSGLCADDITRILKDKSEKAFHDFEALYNANKSKASVYEHRLSSIIR